VKEEEITLSWEGGSPAEEKLITSNENTSKRTPTKRKGRKTRIAESIKIILNTFSRNEESIKEGEISEILNLRTKEEEIAQCFYEKLNNQECLDEESLEELR
jgi:hypothetical protein